jgi:hypothetical protein
MTLTIPEPETVTVDIDGKTATWADGWFTGDPDLLAEAALSVEIQASFQLGFADVTAGDDTALGAAAALASYKPGRARFLTLPADVAKELYGGHNDPTLFD